MCVLKNHPLTGQPIDFQLDPPTCCPDCQLDWEYQKSRYEKDKFQNQQLYKMQIGQLTGVVNFNNSIITQLIKNQSFMMNHVSQLQSIVKQLRSQLEKKAIPKALALNQDDKKDRLINILFKRTSFAYSMVLTHQFQPQLYKEKNFNISIKLIDSESNFVRNCNPIPITFKIYNSNLQFPEPIQSNKTGMPLMKGNTQTQLYHGVSQFNKLHFRQVTSYFENGWVYLVVFAKAPSFNYTSSKSQFDLEVIYSDIKPLVLSQVCVRAKPKRKI